MQIMYRSEGEFSQAEWKLLTRVCILATSGFFLFEQHGTMNLLYKSYLASFLNADIPFPIEENSIGVTYRLCFSFNEKYIMQNIQAWLNPCMQTYSADLIWPDPGSNCILPTTR